MGEGFYGRVYKAYHKRAKKMLVLKELKRFVPRNEAFILQDGGLEWEPKEV